MSFIAKHITHHDERLIYLARLHWIYLVKGISWFITLGVFGAYINWKYLVYVDVLPSQTLKFLPAYLSFLADFAVGLTPAIIGLIIFLIYMAKMLGTEIALTNRRLIYKTGLFFIQSSEVELSEVMEAKVDNGLFGAILGYGILRLDCRFVGDFELPYIRKPYNLLRQINKLHSEAEAAAPHQAGLPV